MVKRTRIDELEGAERLVRQRVTDGDQIKIKAERCADFILDKGDEYLSERIDGMDCEAVKGLQEVFVKCRYDLDDISMKISPFFEAYVSQLNDTIREAEEARNIVVSAFSVVYAKGLTKETGKKISHSALNKMPTDRLDAIKGDEKKREDRAHLEATYQAKVAELERQVRALSIK